LTKIISKKDEENLSSTGKKPAGRGGGGEGGKKNYYTNLFTQGKNNQPNLKEIVTLKRQGGQNTGGKGEKETARMLTLKEKKFLNKHTGGRGIA